MRPSVRRSTVLAVTIPTDVFLFSVGAPIVAATRTVSLTGCRQNNLRGFDAEISLHRLVSITGRSGSGRSSFVFATVHAESRRRYIESFSTSARKNLESLARPKLDGADHLPLTVAIRSDSLARGPRNTVATATGILPHLAQLFSRQGQPHCPACDRAVRRYSPEEILAELDELPDGTRVQLGFRFRENIPVNVAADWLVKSGFARCLRDGETHSLDELTEESGPVPPAGLPVIVDRLKTGSGGVVRLRESLELCFRGGNRDCFVLAETPFGSDVSRRPVDGGDWFERVFSRDWRCHGCNRLFLEAQPALFSFSTAIGACPQCRGIGAVRESRSALVEDCPECGGTRLGPDARAYRIGDDSLPDLLRLSLGALVKKLGRWKSSGTIEDAAGSLELRLHALQTVCVSHLPLNLPVRRLTSSETRRIALADAAASPLTGALYLIEAPSSGLPRGELPRIRDAIETLYRAGNSVWLVDDHPDFIAHADSVVRFGPAGGADGGSIVFQGTADEYRSEFAQRDAPELTLQTDDAGEVTCAGWEWPGVRLASLTMPLRKLIVVTGASNTRSVAFFRDVLAPSVRGTPDSRFGTVQVDGLEQIDETISIAPESRTPPPRSLVVSSLKIFGAIRALLADVPEARRRSLSLRSFSLNVADGVRCPACDGTGMVAVDLQHLPDLELVCPECEGNRYQPFVKEIRYRGLNVIEILELTADEAFRFFKGHPLIQRKLQMLRELNLQYLRLGQARRQLSLGERCRLQLASESARVSQNRRLLLIEEPTTGLARDEVASLVQVFRRLTEAGASLLIAEHHPILLDHADTVIDLGQSQA